MIYRQSITVLGPRRLALNRENAVVSVECWRRETATIFQSQTVWPPRMESFHPANL